MQVWIVSVIIIFALSQFWEWLNNTEFSLPVLGVAGLCLAIASNYDKRHSFPFWPAADVSATAQPATPQPTTIEVETPGILAANTKAVALPEIDKTKQPNPAEN